MQWMTHTPEGSFATVCNGERYAEMVRSQGGENALKQWKQLEDKMRPLQQGAALFPAAALRSDPGDTMLPFVCHQLQKSQPLHLPVVAVT